MILGTNNRLITIFNANDPTPTAKSLRSIKWSEATVLLVGASSFRSNQSENLRRLKSWLSGSPRGHSVSSRAWPDAYWNQNWNWQPLSEARINFVEVEDIFSLDFTFKQGDTIDLTSGTKEMSAYLTKYAVSSISSLKFTIQTQSGQILNLTDGTLASTDLDLNLNERVFLASGYILDAGRIVESGVGDQLINAEKLEQTEKKPSLGIKNVDAIGLSKNRTRIFFDETADGFHDIMKNMHWDEETSWDHGFWLEDTVGDLLLTWPSITEVMVNPRLIPCSFDDAIHVSSLTLSRSNEVDLPRVEFSILD